MKINSLYQKEHLSQIKETQNTIDEISGIQNKCRSNREGDMCSHPNCPQIRDGEPEKTGRSCPLYHYDEDYYGL